jgi:hypothetical protein
MARPRIVLNKAGIRDLLRSPEMVAVVGERAERIAAAAGDGHIVETEVGPNRARASVRTGTFEAIVSESKNQTLTRAIDAAR